MKTFSFIIVLLLVHLAYGQVKIGANIDTIDGSSLVELESDSKVFVLTRVSTAQMNGIIPLNGALVYNTDDDCLFQYRNNAWQSLCVNVAADETVTTIADNNDGTFTYLNETATNVAITKANLTDNGDGTYLFDNNNGLNITIDTNADSSSYDGTLSSLTAINVQDAIDQLAAGTVNGTGNITSTDLTVSGDLNALLGNVALEITAGAVGTIELAANAVTTAEILDGTIATTDMADNAIATAKLVDNAVTTTKITPGANNQSLITDNTGTVTWVDSNTLHHTGTTGSLFFANTDGTPTENNSELFWDNINNRLGIGTISPTGELQVIGQVRATSFANDDGTANMPSYHFNSNPNTGIYLGGTEQLGFSTAGTEALRINNAQNVGVGDFSSGTIDASLHIKSTDVPLKIEPSTTTPSGSSGGQMFVSNDNGLLYLYDGTRSKWLSVDRSMVGWGRNSGNTSNQYLRQFNGALSNQNGWRMIRDGTITAITAQSNINQTWTLEIRKNDSPIVIASILITNAQGDHDNTINIDFSEGDFLQAYCNGASVDYPQTMIEIAWRK